MLPIKNILCPTDFSEPSYEALKVADELAVHFGATLHIVNVVPLVPIVEAPIGVESASFNVASYQQELESQAKKSLKSLVDQKVGKGVNVDTEVLIGNAAGEVMRYASEKSNRHHRDSHSRTVRLAQIHLGLDHRADSQAGLLPGTDHTKTRRQIAVRVVRQQSSSS